MILITAGNHKFKQLIKHSLKQANKFNYVMRVFDLGNLGFGELYKVDNLKSTCIHKPALIKKVLMELPGQLIVYLDGDAFINDKIDEIDQDYDLGLTIRNPEEKQIAYSYSWINAGVMFLRSNPQMLSFVDQWEIYAQKFKDDQKGLSKLLNIKKRDIIQYPGIKIQTFPTNVYNNYYGLKNAKIDHLKLSSVKTKYNPQVKLL